MYYNPFYETSLFEACRWQEYAASKAAYARALQDQGFLLEARTWQASAARAYKKARFYLLIELEGVL